MNGRQPVDNDERDELAAIIKREYVRAIDRKRPQDAYHAPADAILAVGYRKPRTVTTAEELDSLPAGSVVLHMGEAFKRFAMDGLWYRPGSSTGFTLFAQEQAPATVLHVGDAA